VQARENGCAKEKDDLVRIGPYYLPSMTEEKEVEIYGKNSRTEKIPDELQERRKRETDYPSHTSAAQRSKRAFGTK